MSRLASFILNTIAASTLFSERWRLYLYQQFGLKSTSAQIYARCGFSDSDLSRVSIGKNTFVHGGVQFDNSAEIEIGEGVDIAMNVQLITTTHSMEPTEKRMGWGCTRRPIAIDNDCWIGANVTIMPGVTVGAGCMIGTGSLVTNNCEPGGLYLGVPARRVRSLDAGIDAQAALAIKVFIARDNYANLSGCL